MRGEIPTRAAHAAGRETAQTKSNTVPREPGKGPAPAQPSPWQVTQIRAATDCLGHIVSYRDLGGLVHGMGAGVWQYPSGLPPAALHSVLQNPQSLKRSFQPCQILHFKVSREKGTGIEITVSEDKVHSHI